MTYLIYSLTFYDMLFFFFFCSWQWMPLNLQIIFPLWFPRGFGLEKQPLQDETWNHVKMVWKRLWVHLQRSPNLVTFLRLTTTDSFCYRIYSRTLQLSRFQKLHMLLPWLIGFTLRKIFLVSYPNLPFSLS